MAFPPSNYQESYHETAINAMVELFATWERLGDARWSRITRRLWGERVRRFFRWLEARGKEPLRRVGHARNYPMLGKKPPRTVRNFGYPKSSIESGETHR